VQIMFPCTDWSLPLNSKSLGRKMETKPNIRVEKCMCSHVIWSAAIRQHTMSLEAKWCKPTYTASPCKVMWLLLACLPMYCAVRVTLIIVLYTILPVHRFILYKHLTWVFLKTDVKTTLPINGCVNGPSVRASLIIKRRNLKWN
jgi:hypothetical protein